MSYEKATEKCDHCGQRFMTKDIAFVHEKVCPENDE